MSAVGWPVDSFISYNTTRYRYLGMTHYLVLCHFCAEASPHSIEAGDEHGQRGHGGNDEQPHDQGGAGLREATRASPQHIHIWRLVNLVLWFLLRSRLQVQVEEVACFFIGSMGVRESTKLSREADGSHGMILRWMAKDPASSPMLAIPVQGTCGGMDGRTKLASRAATTLLDRTSLLQGRSHTRGIPKSIGPFL